MLIFFNSNVTGSVLVTHAVGRGVTSCFFECRAGLGQMRGSAFAHHRHGPRTGPGGGIEYQTRGTIWALAFFVRCLFSYLYRGSLWLCVLDEALDHLPNHLALQAMRSQLTGQQMDLLPPAATRE